MIGFFTDPYPDELLYSACARYHRRARNSIKEATARDLFGNPRTKIIVDLQVRLNYLAAQLPPATYSVSRLIDEYTMLPLYAPFMPAERHDALRHDMSGEGGGSVHARLGVLTSGINVEHLRFCPACAEEDRGLYGEPYWHRIHQAPGIEACPAHTVFLSDSAVSVRNRNNGRALVTARQAISELSSASRAIRPLDLKDREHNVLLRLAQDAAWILGTRIEVPDQNVLRRRYFRLLLEQGMATYGGNVSHTRLKARFLDYYPPSLLKRLGCGLELRYHWLLRLVNDWARTRHPLHHLLLIQFLGSTAEKFFGLSTEVEPFGKGPWPCLNAAGGHYRETRIVKCQISHAQRSKQLEGTFRCECGFSYKRIGLDTTDERRYEYDRIVSFGNAWYDNLSGMLASGNHSRPEMARALGVSVNTVVGEIRRLKSTAESGLPLTQRYHQHRADSAASDIELHNKYRKQWRKRVIENPNASRSEHRSVVPEAYNWLAKHDKKWLEENSPERRTRCGTSPRVDWSKRDEKYSADVLETTEEILSAPGHPVRASATGVAKKLGILTVIRKNSAKLPLTIKTLADVSESTVSFAVRRIRWAAGCYRQEQVPACWSKLLTRAAISNQMVRNLEVKLAIEECVWMLRDMNERGWEDPAGE